MAHSRWLTTANRILRLYISTDEPSENLNTIAQFLMKVYAPTWFDIKKNSSMAYGLKHLFSVIKRSAMSPEHCFNIVKPVIQWNGFFAHSENLLLAMVYDDNQIIKELGWRRILKLGITKRLRM